MLKFLFEEILSTGSRVIVDGSLRKELCEVIESSTRKNINNSFSLLKACVESFGIDENAKILDFGCGEGKHQGKIENLGLRYYGLNYAEGMADNVRFKQDDNHNIVYYDGRKSLFEDAFFDFIYSNQVFEHLPDPYTSFHEINRIMMAKGFLVGSVSQLEQIHDYSTFNFTPYGLKKLCSSTGFHLAEIYPIYDAFSFLLRRLQVSITGSNETDFNELLSRAC